MIAGYGPADCPACLRSSSSSKAIVLRGHQSEGDHEHQRVSESASERALASERIAVSVSQEKSSDFSRVSSYSGEIFFCGVPSMVIPCAGINPVSLKPGIGFKDDGCGAWVRKLQSGDEYRDIYHNCGNLHCPVCMEGTLTDKAQAIEERFEQYEQAKRAEGAVLVRGEFIHAYPRHFIFSISPEHQAVLVSTVRSEIPGEWDDRHAALFLDILREEYNRALKISGLLGGVSVYHDARVRHPGTGSIGARAKRLIGEEAREAGNMKEDDPVWKLYDHIRKQENWSEYYYLSAHFHCQVYGQAINAREFEALMPGWKYHNKGKIKRPGGLSRYLISHMAMIPGRESVSWFGRLSSKSLGKYELREPHQEKVICEKTGLPWVIIDSVIPEEIGQYYYETITEYRCFFHADHKYDSCWYGCVRYPDDKKIEKLKLLPELEKDNSDNLCPEETSTLQRWDHDYDQRNFSDKYAGIYIPVWMGND